MFIIKCKNDLSFDKSIIYAYIADHKLITFISKTGKIDACFVHKV